MPKEECKICGEIFENRPNDPNICNVCMDLMGLYRGEDDYGTFIRSKAQTVIPSQQPPTASSKAIKHDGDDTIHQPPPTGNGQVVLFEVLKDLRKRAIAGRVKYGTMLRVSNGRDALVDAYQESLDLCMYLKQVLMERDKCNKEC